MRKIIALAAFCCTFSLILRSESKPALTHSVYDDWKSVSTASVPHGGQWAIYNVKPQQGDGTVTFMNTVDGRTYSCERAADVKISLDGTRAVFRITPKYTQTRKAKIDKKKPDDMPHDTLAVMDLATGKITRFGMLNSLRTPEFLTDWVAYSRYPAGKKDTTIRKEDLIILNIKTIERTDTLRSVSSVYFPRRGDKFAYVVKPEKKDTVHKAGYYCYVPSTKESTALLTGPQKARFGSASWNDDASRLVFYANPDTSKAESKLMNIYLSDGCSAATLLAGSHAPGIPEGWRISEKTTLAWRGADSYIVAGTAPIPAEKDTSIVDFEYPKLDIWTWNEDYLQPFQKLNMRKELDRGYFASVRISDGVLTQIADEQLPSVSVSYENLGTEVLAGTNKPYRIQTQWEDDPCSDYYIVNVATGAREKIAEAKPWTGFTNSPDGRFCVFYDAKEAAWYLLRIATREITPLTKDIDADFSREGWDTPCLPAPAGGATWSRDSRYVILADQRDLWVFDAEGVKAPWMLSEGKGRETFCRYRLTVPYSDPDGWKHPSSIDFSKPVYMQVFDLDSREYGFAVKDISRRRPSPMRLLVKGPYTYSSPVLSTAPKKPVMFYLRENFEEGRNLFCTADEFATEKRITLVNPQQNDYNWGTVELLQWKHGDGSRAEALVYKPEDFDPAKKYPVIFYFYEKNADTRYTSYSPAPSRSVVNFPMFVSNGYVIVIPDMYYKNDGHPGRDGLASLMSCVDKVCENPWVDQDHMGIQGQSWGGYQVAWFITQTNRFAAAGSGAPVSNMTSAYGGIRWGSGIVREIQYEHGQSRIGKDLWSGYDLYYENSPLFFVPNVTTPVLIMHNDADGAVPWWQGIEFFTALRRNGKPCWLLQYNGEQHNLSARHNSKDLSIRMMQFFDHYLKGAPMPEWMEKGIPATKKGTTLGYRLPGE